MFLRSKVQEMILRRYRSMNGGGGGGQQGVHLSGGRQATDSSTTPCYGGGKAVAPPRPRLLHSSSLPAGGGGCTPDSETTAALCSMSPTSVLDASPVFKSSLVDGGSKLRPWHDGCAGPHGLADALDCADDDAQAQRERSVLAAVSRAACLVRSCSLDRRRVEFGVKNKSSWLPLRAGGTTEAAAADMAGEMEPSSEDYTCVISRGPNPRTVHIFGGRVVDGDRESSPPRPLKPPAIGSTGFLSL